MQRVRTTPMLPHEAVAEEARILRKARETMNESTWTRFACDLVGAIAAGYGWRVANQLARALFDQHGRPR